MSHVQPTAPPPIGAKVRAIKTFEDGTTITYEGIVTGRLVHGGFVIGKPFGTVVATTGDDNEFTTKVEILSSSPSGYGVDLVLGLCDSADASGRLIHPDQIRAMLRVVTE